MKLITIEDFDLEMTKKSADFLAKCTVQLFREDDVKGMVAHGCGILFTFKKNYFIITASHNYLDEDKSELKIRIGDNLEKINHSELRWPREGTNSSINKLDTAILKIKDQSLVEMMLENNVFLTLEDLELNHKQKVLGVDTDTPSDIYILFGYPAKKTKSKYKSPFEWTISALNIHCNTQFIDWPKLEGEGYINHIFFDKYRKGKKQLTHEKVQLPSFKGMSGCGLWDVLGYDRKNERYKLKLVGIFIEVNYRYGISTKINVAIEIIRDQFGLRTLPSTKVNINLDSNKGEDLF